VRRRLSAAVLYSILATLLPVLVIPLSSPLKVVDRDVQ
jgi:hypothetical protein